MFKIFNIPITIKISELKKPKFIYVLSENNKPIILHKKIEIIVKQKYIKIVKFRYCIVHPLRRAVKIASKDIGKVDKIAALNVKVLLFLFLSFE